MADIEYFPSVSTYVSKNAYLCIQTHIRLHQIYKCYCINISCAYKLCAHREKEETYTHKISHTKAQVQNRSRVMSTSGTEYAYYI